MGAWSEEESQGRLLALFRLHSTSSGQYRKSLGPLAAGSLGPGTTPLPPQPWGSLELSVRSHDLASFSFPSGNCRKSFWVGRNKASKSDRVFMGNADSSSICSKCWLNIFHCWQKSLVFLTAHKMLPPSSTWKGKLATTWLPPPHLDVGCIS